MDTASLLVAAWLNCAVAAGWQPDPEFAGAYVVTVHVDSATAQRLAQGSASALDVDVPADIAPVSRVQVDSSGSAPIRRRQMTLLKPEIPDGVVLAQYYEPAGQASASPPASWGAALSQPATSAVQPWPSSSAGWGQAAVDQFHSAANQSTAALQAQLQSQIQQVAAPLRDGASYWGQSFQSAVDSVGQQSGGLLRDAMPPLDGQGLFRQDAASAWPGWGQSQFGAATSPSNLASVSSPWPTTATPPTPMQAEPWAAPGAPTPAAWGQGSPAQPHADPRYAAGQQPSPAAPSSVGWSDGARSQTAANDPRQPYPGASQPPAALAGRERIDQPIDPRDAGQWTMASSQTAQPASQGAGASQPGSPSAWPQSGVTPSAASAAGRSGDWPELLGRSQQPGSLATSTPSTWSQSSSSLNSAAGGSAGHNGAGLDWPNDWPYYDQDGILRTASQPSRTGSAGAEGPSFPATQGPSSGGASGPPAVTKEMLFANDPRDADMWPNAPGGAERTSAPGLDAMADTTKRPSPFDADLFAVAPPQSSAGAAGNSEEGSSGSQSPLWTMTGGGGTKPTEMGANHSSADPASPRNMIPVVVAWVLLFGSIAGNAYLLWSYLEVRMKYRTLVRRNGQGVRSRFSPAL
ncbi:MAG: hypothetical protein KF847_20515 [Pirellulales bacterium]|nr:hypothetical protein [Pirellulales bacterium]